MGVDIEPVVKGKDAADILHVSMKTLKSWIRSGYIKGKKIGGRWYVEGESLRKIMEFERDGDEAEKSSGQQDLRTEW